MQALLDALIEPKRAIAEALEGLEDWQAASILSGMVKYGWKRPDGTWHDSPFYPDSTHKAG